MFENIFLMTIATVYTSDQNKSLTIMIITIL